MSVFHLPATSTDLEKQNIKTDPVTLTDTHNTYIHLFVSDTRPIVSIHDRFATTIQCQLHQRATQPVIVMQITDYFANT